MIRRILALLFLATQAAAAEVAIQAGEHDGYTRLALHLGGAGWQFGRVAGGYGLRVDASPDFRIDSVHETITRDRIAALHPVPDGLDLALGCDCHARIFPYGEGWLVVDIVDGAADPAGRHEQPLDPQTSQMPPAPPIRPAARPPAPVIDRGALPLFLPARDRPAFATRSAATAAAPAPMPATTADPAANPAAPGLPASDLPAADGPPTDTLAAGVGQTMAEGMIRAADLGLLDLARPRAVLDAAPGLPASDLAAPPAPASATTGAAPPAAPGVTAQTGMDDALAIAGARAGGACPDPALFDLGLWSGGGDFFAEIAPLRAALSDAHGRPAPGAAEALARAYLAYGFGREAAETLALAPQPGPERDLLHLLARIIDARPADPAALDGLGHCGGPVLLWRALARDSLHDLDEVQRIELVTAARRLPDALRRQIAPRLALLFAAAGDPLAADELLARDAGAEDRATIARAEIEVARAADDPGATATRAALAAHGDSRAGPQALIDLVDLAIAGHREAEPGDLALLAAAAFEYRDQPEEAALLDARIRLLSHMGDHRAALGLAQQLPQAGRAAPLAHALEQFSRMADDGEFIELAFDDLARPADAHSANLLAARLLALGFPDRALALMQNTDPGDTLLERRYLRAEAAAALGRADLVEAELLGLADPRAEAIRTRITPAPPASGPSTAPAALPPQRPDDLAGPLARGTALVDEAGSTTSRARALLDEISAGSLP